MQATNEIKSNLHGLGIMQGHNNESFNISSFVFARDKWFLYFCFIRKLTLFELTELNVNSTRSNFIRQAKSKDFYAS